MSKVLVQIQENSQSQLVILPNTNTTEVINTLLAENTQNEDVIVENFLSRKGLIISADTPDSSWVDRIEFNAHAGELTFISDAGSRIPYRATFKGFLEALKAPSAGKLQHEYRRGLR